MVQKSASGLKRCLVTGASRGIGRCIAENLQEAGYCVIGLARSRPSDWRGEFIIADLSNQESTMSAGREIVSRGSMYALVNNAGFAKSDSLEDGIDPEETLNSYMINCVAPTLLASFFAKVAERHGRIVNICSNTMLGKANRSAYAGSKAALAALTKVWALELSSKQILVNGVSPGAVDTEMIRRKIPVGSRQERELINSIPLGKLTGPNDVATMVNFLLCSSVKNITGQIIHIDGGTSTSKNC